MADYIIRREVLAGSSGSALNPGLNVIGGQKNDDNFVGPLISTCDISTVVHLHVMSCSLGRLAI